MEEFATRIVVLETHIADLETKPDKTATASQTDPVEVLRDGELEETLGIIFSYVCGARVVYISLYV